MAAVNVTDSKGRITSDKDFGREEYVDFCVDKVMAGETVLVALDCRFSTEDLPAVFQKKYQPSSRFSFSGFSGALEEIIAKVEKLGKKVLSKDFFGSSDLLGDIYRNYSPPDGYLLSLEPEEKTS